MIIRFGKISFTAFVNKILHRKNIFMSDRNLKVIDMISNDCV